MTASSIYFQSFPYGLDPATQLIDYEGLKKQARIFKPRLIICGASAYPRDWDYAALRATADEHGAFLMADIAHTSGLVAAGEDVVSGQPDQHIGTCRPRDRLPRARRSARIETGQIERGQTGLQDVFEGDDGLDLAWLGSLAVAGPRKCEAGYERGEQGEGSHLQLRRTPSPGAAF